MRRAEEMAALAQLAGLASDAAEARLAAHLRRAAELRKSLTALEGERRERATSLTEADPALRAGADLRWHHWIDSRRALLNAELARSLAEADRTRAAVRQAFGKKMASEAVARESLATQGLLAARRAERDQLS